MKTILAIMLMSLVLVPAAQAELDLTMHDALTDGIQVASKISKHSEYNASVDKLVQSEAENRRLKAEVKHKNKGLIFIGGVVVALILHDMHKGNGGGGDDTPDPKPHPKPKPCITW